MTAKYKEIWEVEGAVDPSIGAKRVFTKLAGYTLSELGGSLIAKMGWIFLGEGGLIKIIFLIE